MPENKKVLVTGGSGQLGQMFLRHYGDYYRLCLTYHTNPFEAPDHEVVQMDLTDYDAVLSAVQGVDAVVHFGADSGSRAPWDSILPNNIVGTYNAYEAAREADVMRFVFASSNHATGFALQEQDPVGPDAPIQIGRAHV